MRLKHKVTINVSDNHGHSSTVLKGADMHLPRRLVKFLFGDYTQIYLLSPGQSVESVNVHEVKEGGCHCGES